MVSWTPDVDRDLTGVVADIVAARDRDQAWHRFLVPVAPHLEAWIRKNRLLQRVNLAGEDDVRAVLVNTLVRLKQDDFANLKKFLAVGHTDDDLRTPLRAWLLTLVGFAVKDHVKQRLGWGTTARVQLAISGLEGRAEIAAALRDVRGIVAIEDERGRVVVEYMPGALGRRELTSAIAAAGIEARVERGAEKRDMHTGAESLDEADEGAARPPMTDWLTVARLAEEARDYMATFPSPMRAALELWLADFDFDEIAERLMLEPTNGHSPRERARALVRAGHARLRERFRGERLAFLGEAG